MIEAASKRKQLSLPIPLGPTMIPHARATRSQSCANPTFSDQGLILNPGSKRLEVGYIRNRQLLTVYLFCERFPVWLLSLDSTWVCELVICGYNSLTDLFQQLSEAECEFVQMLLAPFVASEVKCLSKLGVVEKSAHIFLISGSLFPFVLSHTETYQSHQTLGVVDAHYEGRLRNGRPTGQNINDSQRVNALSNSSWHRFRHLSIGGATNFVSLFSRTQVDTFPIVTSLQRGIRNFLNWSVRPGPPPQHLPENRNGSYYIPDDRLIPGLYELPLLVSSYFHSSGKGYRVLLTEELASIHGFPRQQILSTFPRSLLAFPPCQLLTASLNVAWTVEAEQTSPVLASNPRPSKRSRDSETHTWLPDIQRYLPHDWVDVSVITATASKADDAAAPCRL